MITRRGVGIIAVAIAVFFLASTTRVGWVHLGDAVLWGVVLLSLAIPWVSAPGLKVHRSLASSEVTGGIGPIEGDDVPVTLTLENRWWLPRFLVSVSYTVVAAGSERTQRSIFFWTSPKRSNQSQSPFNLERRGQHTFGEAVVEITGPFGLFRRRRRFQMTHGVLAYPAWQPMRRMGLMESMAGEHEGRRKARTGTDASGTRPYVPGDSYRTIHWRNSARSGRLAVREFDTWNDRSVALAIDTANARGDSPESSIDYAARIAASCARVIEQEGGTISVITATGTSTEFLAWPGVMEHIARMESDAGKVSSLARDISNLHSGKRLMAFLTAGSDAEAAAVCAAARRGISAVTVMFIPDDHEDVADGADVAMLRQAGVPVVLCAPGGLDAAIREIETGISSASASTPSFHLAGQAQVAA